MVEFRWEGGRASWMVRRALADTLEEQAAKMQRRIKRIINTPYPPASSPGNPPHKRTGLLRSSVYWDVNRRTLTATVGVAEDAFYWKFLEEGTRFMDARPFLQPTLDAMLPTIKIELARSMRRRLKQGNFGTLGKAAGKKKEAAKKSIKKIAKKTKRTLKKKAKSTKRSAKKLARKAKKTLRKGAKAAKRGLKKAKSRIKKAVKNFKKKRAASKKKAAKKPKVVKRKAVKKKTKAKPKSRGRSKASGLGKALRKIAKKKINLPKKLLSGDKLTRFLLREARKYQ